MTIERDPPSCGVDLTRQGTTATVAVDGEIDMDSVDLLRAAVGEAVRGVEQLVIDLTEVTFMDSTAVRALLEARSLAEAAGGRLVVVVERDGPPEQVLKLCGLHERLAVVHDGH